MSRFRIDWERKDARLIALREQGQPTAHIAEVLGVTRGAVINRLRKLGLMK